MFNALIDLLFLQDDSKTVFQNGRNHLYSDTALWSKRPEYTETTLWKPRLSKLMLPNIQTFIQRKDSLPRTF